jgi:hypothetical protein
MVMVIQLTADELAILSTAIAILQKHGEPRRGLVICADGKLRRLSKELSLSLIDRLSQLAGHDAGALKREAVELAKQVRS